MSKIDTALAFLKSKIPGVIAFPPAPVSPPQTIPSDDTATRGLVNGLALVLRSIAHGTIAREEAVLSARSVLTKFGLQEGPVLLKNGTGWSVGSAAPPSHESAPEPAMVPSERLRVEWMSGASACKAVYDPRERTLRYYRGGTSRPALVVPQTTLSEAQFVALVEQLKSLP